jgi:large subunit ribosomal protein L6
MSRIGKKPVIIPDGVEVQLKGNAISVKGPKGSLDLTVDPVIKIEYDADAKQVSFSRKNNLKQTRCKHGLYRSLFNNNVIGVTQGYKKVLLIEGVGYRAVLNGKNIELNIGFTDKKIVEIPDDITVDLPKPTQIEVTGIDKQKVGHIAALIRRFYPPEPYKGKGIRYEDEVVRRKVGKTFAAEGA